MADVNAREHFKIITSLIGAKMNTILITGFSGFVAHHFLQFLYDNRITWKVHGIDIREPGYDYKQYQDRLKIQFDALDLLNLTKTLELIERVRPTYILHLASFSSVAYSWSNPCESFANNTNIFLNIVTAVRDSQTACRILSVGSSEEYGNVYFDRIPLRESDPLNPLSPYAVARVSQEMLSRVFAESCEMDIVMTRSFNHIGPWQDERFVVPSFIRRILDIVEAGENHGTIITGDTTVIRDFVDVRDVVRAYYLLLCLGRKGEVYNICSGKGHALFEVIKMISQELNVNIVTEIDPKLLRPQDNKIVIGSAAKLRHELEWNCEISLEQTIKDMIYSMQ